VSACLYERLGGAAAVAAVIDDAVDRHATNPTLSRLFCGRDLPRIKAVAVSIFSASLGGPCSAQAAGEAPPNAAMRVSPAELQAVLGDMSEAVREHGLGAIDVAQIVSLLYAAREPPPAC